VIPLVLRESMEGTMMGERSGSQGRFSVISGHTLVTFALRN